MSKVNGAKKLTDNSFLKLYELDAETKDNIPLEITRTVSSTSMKLSISRMKYRQLAFRMEEYGLRIKTSNIIPL